VAAVAIAEFERARIAERVRLGVARAKAQGNPGCYGLTFRPGFTGRWRGDLWRPEPPHCGRFFGSQPAVVWDCLPGNRRSHYGRWLGRRLGPHGILNARRMPCAKAIRLWTVWARRTIAFCKQIERCSRCAPKAAPSTAIGKAEPLLVARTETGTNWCRVGGVDYYSRSPADGTRLLTVCSGVVRSNIQPGPGACFPDQLTLCDRVAKRIHD